MTAAEAPLRLRSLPGRVSTTPAWHGTFIVWRWELVKLTGQLRVRAAAGLCVAVPLLVAGAFAAQSAVPADTLFGQWVRTSGFATPLVVLSFAGQWVLPLLTSLVAGDVFSSEDHLGTWKTVLSRSRTRGELFAGKLLAALTYTVAVLALLAAASLVAGTLLGRQPLVGLSGQLVPPGRATWLVALSWASQLAPMCAYCALAVLVSVAGRNSLVGIGVPALLAAALQVLALVDLPVQLRSALPSTPFGSWHGLWTQPPFTGPLLVGLLTSASWFAACTALSWLVFRRRSFRVG